MRETRLKRAGNSPTSAAFASSNEFNRASGENTGIDRVHPRRVQAADFGKRSNGVYYRVVPTP
jgi:hypothetical protein